MLQSTPVNEPPYEDIQAVMALGQDPMGSGLALNLVTQTYYAFEWYRTQNHDPRWSAADSLFYAWVPAKVWEGTNTPRASIGYRIVYNQISAALPAISQALFGVGPDWFQAEPGMNVNPEMARLVQDTISYMLDHPKDDYGSNAQNEIEQAALFLLLYGNGGIGLEWDPVEKRAKISNVDIREFYIDPNLSTPGVDEGRATIRRKMMTVQQLVELGKADPRIKLPSIDGLHYLAKCNTFTVGDQTKATAMSYRGINYVPGTSDWMPSPAAGLIEVLTYYDKDRIIWVLGRRWVAYNETNPYGFIPFCFAPCSIVPGRFYAQSMADLSEQNQRYAEALLNAHLDELSLRLHPPRGMNRASNLTANQTRWRPGAVYPLGDPQKDMQVLEIQPQTAGVFDEISFLERAAEMSSGVNSLGMGVPRPGNANRTATGIQAQTQGSAGRLTMIVSNIENYLIVPMLYKLYRMIQLHIAPWDSIPARRDGTDYRVSGMVFRSKMHFRMFASSRMLTRDKLMQVFPFIMQYLMGGQFVSSLNATGQTVDWQVVSQMLQDATGTSRQYKLFRPMSEQEQQAMNQPPPEAQMAQQRSEQAEQTRLKIASDKNQTELQKVMLQKQPDQGEMEREQQKLRNEQMLAAITAQSKREELEFKRQEASLKLETRRQESAQKIQQTQFESMLRRQQGVDQLQLDKASAEQNFQTQIEGNKIKLDTMRQQARMRPPKKDKGSK